MFVEKNNWIEMQLPVYESLSQECEAEKRYNDQGSQNGNSRLDFLRGTAHRMRIISKKTLKEFWEREPASEGELKAWHAEAKSAERSTPADVKDHYGNASILKNGRVVFNICGNKYRLVVWINFEFSTIYVRFVGTHSEYDEIDAQTI